MPFDVIEEVAGSASVKPSSGFDVISEIGQPEQLDDPGISTEIGGIVRGAERSGRRFLQQFDVSALRRPQEIEKELATANAELAEADRFFKTRTPPAGFNPNAWNAGAEADYAQQMRNVQGNSGRKVAMLTQELSELKGGRSQRAAEDLSAQQRAINLLPPTPAQSEYEKAEGFTGHLKALAKNPVEIGLITTAESLPSMAGPVVGSVLGPLGTAAGAAVSSFTAESSANVIAGMQEAGVDTTNPKDVLAFFSDKARLNPVAAKADLKALGPAAFDSLTAGMAGKILGPLLGKGVGKVAAGTAGEIGMQMAGGGLGSIAGSKLVGEPIDWGDVLLEVVGELAPVEAASNIRGERARSRSRLEATPTRTRIDPVTREAQNVTAKQPIEDEINRVLDSRLEFESPDAQVGQEFEQNGKRYRVREITTIETNGKSKRVASAYQIETPAPPVSKNVPVPKPPAPAAPTPVAPVVAPPDLPEVKPGFVRMYHGGSDPTGNLNAPRDITQYYDYARGYADKSGAPVWYVDVPVDAPYMKKAFEEFDGGPKAPYINTVAPAEVMVSARKAQAQVPAAPAAIPEVTPAQKVIADVEALGTEQAGQLKQRAAVESGLKLTARDAPSLVAARDASQARMMAALESGDDNLFKAEYGRNIYYSGLIEGANRSGPNYEQYVKEVSSDAKKEKEEEKDQLRSKGVTPAASASVKPQASELEMLETAEAEDALSAKQKKRLKELRSAVAAPVGEEPTRAAAASAAPAKAAKSKSAGNVTKVSEPVAVRVLDTQQGASFGASFKELDPIPDDNAKAQQWWDDATMGKGKHPTDNAITKVAIVVRDNDTGQLFEVGAHNNPTPVLSLARDKSGNPVALKARGKGVNAIDFLRTYSKKEGVLQRYTPVASLRYSDARKGVFRTITEQELSDLKTQWSSMLENIPQTGRTAVEITPEGETQEVVVEPAPGVPEPEPLSELESWLRAKLVDKKTGKLKPITQDVARDLVDDFSISEPESAVEIGKAIGANITEQLKALPNRDARLTMIRELFASRIYELVAKQYQSENPSTIGQGDEQGTRRITGAGAIDVASQVQSSGTVATSASESTGPTEAAQQAVAASLADRAIERLERLKISTDKVFMMPDLGITATLWNGTLNVAQAAIKAGQLAAQAIDSAVTWLRQQQPEFNEAVVRARLQAELTPPDNPPSPEGNQSEVSQAIDLALDPVWQQEMDKAVAEAQKNAGIKTKIYGGFDVVADRIGLTPELRARSTAEAKALLLEAGFSEGDLRAERHPNGDIWKLSDEAEKRGNGSDYPLEQQGQKLLTILMRELNAGRGNDPVLGFFLASIRKNIANENVASISKRTRSDLSAYSQGQVSLFGVLLGMQNLGQRSIEYVGSNIRSVLKQVYDARFGEGEGDRPGETAVDSAMRRAFEAFRSVLTPAVIRGSLSSDAAQVLRRLAGDKSDRLQVMVEKVISVPFYSKNELAIRFADLLSDEVGGLTKAQKSEARDAFDAALSEAFKQGTVSAKAAVVNGLTPDQKKRGRKRDSVWRIVEQAVDEGLFDPGKATERAAKARGFELVTDETAQQLKTLVEEMRGLRDIPAGDIARALGYADTPEQRTLAKQNFDAYITQALNERKRKIETRISRLVNPLNLKRGNGENIVRAAEEWTSAGLLLTAGFPLRQTWDVLSQAVLHSGTDAVQAAWTSMEIAKANGQPVAPAKELANALYNGFKLQIQTARMALTAMAATLQGTPRYRNVEDLLTRIGLFERIEQRMNEHLVNKEYAQATLFWLANQVKWGRTFAAASDSIGTTGATFQTLRQQVVHGLRRAGLDRGTAESRADDVVGDVTSEWKEKIILANVLQSVAPGKPYTSTQVKQAAIDMVVSGIYERARKEGLPADDFKTQNEINRETLGWNLPEKGGIGMLAALPIQAARSFGRTAPAIGVFTAPLTAFSNAIHISANRAFSFAGAGMFPSLFGVTKIDPKTGIAENGSPFFRTREQRRQRKVEAALGLSLGTVIGFAVLNGIIAVRWKPPKDKEDRDLWLSQHIPYTVEIDAGIGKMIRVPLTMGFLRQVAPFLVGFGALKDKLEAIDKEQEGINKEAAARGVPPWQAPGLGLNDKIGILWEAILSTLLGGRTASGLVGAVSDFGIPNPIKTAATMASGYVPTVKAWQEIQRWSGVRMDPKAASFWDFFWPLESSGAKAVNMLGDSVAIPSGLQRVAASVGLPYYVDKSVVDPAYAALLTSEYRPPSINARKAYEISGEYRPMNQEELGRYTQLRGQYLKQELTALGPNADEASARAAYAVANERALSDVGVSQPLRGGGGGAGAARTSTPSGRSFSPLPSLAGVSFSGLGAARSSTRLAGAPAGSRLKPPRIKGYRRPRTGSLRPRFTKGRSLIRRRR